MLSCQKELFKLPNTITYLNGAFKTKSTNTLGLVPHLDLLKQEAIANSTAKLTVVPASTKYNVESSILLLKINNKTEKVLFSRIPLKDANTPNFTGNLLFTNLQGELLTLFKVNDGVIYKGYKNKYLDDKGNKKTRKKSGNGDCDENYGEGIFCYNLLDDVVIPVSSNNTSNYIPISYVYFYSFPSYTPSYTPSNSYPHTWGYGGSGGYNPPTPPSPDKIITDEMEDDYPCQSKIIKGTFVKTAPLSKLILDIFELNDNGYNLNFHEDLGLIGTDAQMMTYDPEDSKWNLGEFDIPIGVHPDLLKNGTDLAIASATIHESLHAVILYAIETGKLTPLNTMEDFSLNSTVKAYLDYKILKEEFGGRVDIDPEEVANICMNILWILLMT